MSTLKLWPTFVLFILGLMPPLSRASELLEPWKKAKISVVLAQPQHSIHSYFNTSPESPDGRWVLFFTSRVASAQEGDVCIIERATGKVTTLARDVVVEDAHRVACQQWVSGGKRVVYHNLLKSGASVVMSVEVATGKQQVLARGRQVGIGQPGSDIVPIYGPHWQPGEHRDLELVDVATGEIRQTPLTADLVKKTYPDWVSRQFGDGPVSIYIPMLSPDTKRVFCKLATSLGGDVRSSKASKREGLICFDLQTGKLLSMWEKWGHPAWHPDARHILNVPGIVMDAETGKVQPIPNCPKLPGSHPSFDPTGKLFTSDTTAKAFDGQPGWWMVGIGDVATGAFVPVHTFDHSRGAQSWRVSHPHPVFSADGRRLYFNVSSGAWTQLHVAERP